MASQYLLGSTEDEMEEILSWLPPRDLSSCKCVSKSWESLVTSMVKSPCFINKHIRKSSAFSTTLVFRRTCLFQFPAPGGFVEHPDYRRFDHNKPLSQLTLYNDCDDRIGFVREIVEIPRFVGDMETGSIWVYHHCNGIFFVVNRSNMVFLCNPVLKEWKLIPNSIYALWPTDIIQPSYRSRSLRAMGFGYDSKTDDYMIIFLFSHYAANLKGYTIGAEVYRLSTNSWREIKFMEGRIFDKCCWKSEKGVYCKGFYYWLVNVSFGRRCVISLDLCDEVFRILTSLADVVCRQDIAVWNDSVVLFSTTDNAGLQRSIDIWVLDDQCKWRKHLSIGPFEDVRNPLIFWKSNELLLRKRDDQIASYNIRSRKIRKLSIHKDDRSLCWGFYVESFAPIIDRRRGLAANRKFL